ncbi:MAG: cell division protein SepF [Lachnospiraceae bacterium]|jgi:cell division inhibitor SepF|nr:cell division protein SepF [Lachnospiraceae bacterium]
MGFMDKVLNVMKLNDDYDDDDFYDDDFEEEERKPKKASKKDDIDSGRAKAAKSKVTPIRQRKATGMEVCVVRPGSVEDARAITDTLLVDRTVILNLEGLDVEIAQRIIDFTSGSCYAINGSLQKVSNYIFIITPSTVDISGDFQDILMGAYDVPPM